MRKAIDRLQVWRDGKGLPPLLQSFVWVRRFPLSYWQTAVTILLTLVLALSLARLFWLSFAPSETAAGRPLDGLTISGVPPSGADMAVVDIAALKALALFGSANAPGAAEADKPAEQPMVIAAEETKLDLLLMGVVDSNQPEAARAIIAKGNQQDVYAPGDKLPVGNQVSLDRVLADRVILNNNGRYESLLLYEEGSGAADQGFDNGDNVSRSAAVERRAAPAIEIPENIEETLAAGNVPDSINDVIKLTVAREGNQVIGYRVRPGRYRELFDQFGFKSGDVVTHVNGVGVDDPTQAMAVYREVRTAASARFDLLRDGEALTLEIDLANLDLN